jgi:hypothetical protein
MGSTKVSVQERIRAKRRAATISVSLKTHRRLKAIAAETGELLPEVVNRVVEQEEQRLFWKRYRESIERLRADPEAWAAYKADARDLEGTLMDGLDTDEDWSFLSEAKPEEIEFLVSEEVVGAEAR